MNDLEKYKTSEEFKDYMTGIMRKDDRLKLSKAAVEEAGPIIAEVHSQFQEIRKEMDDLSAVRYLWDVSGYYITLTCAVLNHNKTLTKLLEIGIDKLPEDEKG